MYRIVIIGCGKIGTELARRFRRQNLSVQALVRSPERAAALAGLGLELMQANLDDGFDIGDFKVDGGTVFYLVPPPRGGVHDTRMQAFLEGLSASGQRPLRMIYMSTSGVYGDCQGEWVDETRPPRPANDRARRRLDAETQLQQWCEASNVSSLVLRVGGIYGPGRLPRRRLEKRLPLLREAESGYSNRIHSEDLLQACLAAAERPEVEGIVNVADGHPSTMTDYFLRVAEHLGLPAPLQISLAEAHEVLSESMLEYLTESRRLENRRLCRDLGVTLCFPDLSSGLSGIDEGKSASGA